MTTPHPALLEVTTTVDRAVRDAYFAGIDVGTRKASVLSTGSAEAYLKGIAAGTRLGALGSHSRVHDLEVQLEEAYTTIRCLTRSSA